MVFKYRFSMRLGAKFNVIPLRVSLSMSHVLVFEPTTSIEIICHDLKIRIETGELRERSKVM